MQETLNGIRMTWNIWPSTGMDAARIVVPLSCMYTPLKAIETSPIVEYQPVACKAPDCGAVLNPHCAVDFRSMSWTCPFCLNQNIFPPHYVENISETVLPNELQDYCSTMEYIIPAAAPGPPVFLLLLDITLVEAEFDSVKDSLQQSLAMMPQDALVGLITFGKMCHVHELGTTALAKSYSFSGSKECSAQQVAYQLGFAMRNGLQSRVTSVSSQRFLLPVSQCEFALTSLLDELSGDAWPVGTEQRPFRCTGAALNVAIGLLEVTYPRSSARLMLLTGGPCTLGPGMLVGQDLVETIRSHLDLQKDNPNATYTKDALKFYSSLASRATGASVVVDIFACSLDQVGLYEMKVLADKTAGYMVMSDSFSMHNFKDSFARVFACDGNGYLQLGFNAQIQVLTSRELKCCGAIGSVTPVGEKCQAVAETEIGAGGTCTWIAGSLDRNASIGFYFEVVNKQANSFPMGKQGFLQFKTRYLHPSGCTRLRITTVSRLFADSSMTYIASGFDQEAAAVLMARYAVWKCRDQDPLDVLRWVDRMLIRLVANFATYEKDNPKSFHLERQFAIFSQFIFYLRRSNFLQTFNASPDETAFYRLAILRESITNSFVMVQPALLQYSFAEGAGQAVSLDSSSLKHDVILLLDTFFHLVIWRGDTIESWYQAGYQCKPEYVNFKQLLEQPAQDAKAILDSRFPVPKYVQTNAGGSQARFLTSKMNPSATYKDAAENVGSDSSVLFTDDVSMKVFMEHLIRLTVQS